jgi:hypothetical protein
MVRRITIKKANVLKPPSIAYPYPSTSSLGEGVTADLDGNVYGADFLMDVRKFIKLK